MTDVAVAITITVIESGKKDWNYTTASITVQTDKSTSSLALVIEFSTCKIKEFDGSQTTSQS